MSGYRGVGVEIILNRKAKFRYTIKETYETGIILTGGEVKSIRQKKINISDSYAQFFRNKLFLINCKIEPYNNKGHAEHEIERSRELLMHKKELISLKGQLQKKGLVLVPMKMYWKRNHIKVLLGLGLGKKLHDKKRVLKEKDIQRDTERELKGYY